MTAPVVPPIVPPTIPPPVDRPSEPSPPTRSSTNPARWGRRRFVRIPTLVVGGLLTVALLAGCTYLVANVLVRTTESDSTTLTGEVRRVDVHVTGEVTISTGPVDEVQIDRRSTYGMTAPRIVEELADGLLTVRVECRSLALVICINRVDLVVPPDVSLSVDALSADISDITGDVDVHSGAGSVDLARLTGDLDVSVGGGSIRGIDLRSPRVKADAGAGTVDLTFTAPPEDVDATSGAGSVLVTLPPGDETYRVDADAGAGTDRIRVRTDPTSDRVIRANAGAGDAEVRYP